jgi:CHC2 zinc finger
MGTLAHTARFRRELLPLARSFYERELGELRRPDSRGWAKPKAGCPFHASNSKTSFSVNLTSGAFHCFGCDVGGGDVIAFIRLRYGLNFKEACRRLGCWDDGALKIDMVVVHDAERDREEQQAEKDRSHQERIRARDWLHCCERIYRDSSRALSELREGDEATIHWSILALVTDEIREAETAYLQKAGLA